MGSLRLCMMELIVPRALLVGKKFYLCIAIAGLPIIRPLNPETCLPLLVLNSDNFPDREFLQQACYDGAFAVQTPHNCILRESSPISSHSPNTHSEIGCRRQLAVIADRPTAVQSLSRHNTSKMSLEQHFLPLS